jgi:uncharacterized membrane protein
MRINAFDLINGLPVHVFINHVVVAFVPLFAILFIVINFNTRLREKFGTLVIIGLGLSVISAMVAKKSGEELAGRVGLPVQHSEYGEKLVLVVALLFILALVWFLNIRKPESDRKLPNSVVFVIGKLAALIAVLAVLLTYLSGNSGARATWEERIGQQSQSTPKVQPTETSEPIADGIALAEVAQHSTIDDCWVAISGKVYDLTKFVSQHPGGSDKIERLCGTDGTTAFKGQHRGAEIPENTLSNYQIGTLEN